MGLFSRMKNTLTGGWADVTVNVGEARIGDNLEVMVRASVKEDITVDRVYLKLAAVERVEIDSYSVSVRDMKGHFNSESVDIDLSETFHEKDVTVSGGGDLQAGVQYEWPAEVFIPGGLPPSFRGRYARIEWKIRAGLDMKGNDPDSGWQIIQVQ